MDRFRGDVLKVGLELNVTMKFAGDALMILFQDEGKFEDTDKGNIPIDPNICAIALKCALELTHYQFEYLPSIASLDFNFAQLKLKVKAGLSSQYYFSVVVQSL